MGQGIRAALPIHMGIARLLYTVHKIHMTILNILIDKCFLWVELNHLMEMFLSTQSSQLLSCAFVNVWYWYVT